MNRVDISEAVKITNNRVKPFDGRKRYLATGNLSNQGIDNSLLVDYENKPSRADLIVSEGYLILARMKATNKVFLIDCDSEDLIVSTGFLTLKPKDGFDGRYLYHYFRSKTFQRLKDRYCSGATQKAINNNSFKKLTVPHYEIEQQKKIGQILDAANNLRQKRKQQLALLDNYLKSVFLDMFGDPVKNYKKWKTVLFLKGIKSIKYGTSIPPEFSDFGYPFIRATNIKNGGITSENMLFISELEAKKIMKCKLTLGDIIIVRSGVNTGDNAVVNIEYEDAYAAYDIIIKINNLFHPIFINGLLNSVYKEVLISPLTRRAGQPHLNTMQINNLPIYLPPIKLQNKFASIVEHVEKTKQKMRDSLDEMDNHFNALMQRYFE